MARVWPKMMTVDAIMAARIMWSIGVYATHCNVRRSRADQKNSRPDHDQHHG
jgi:hypothetical protein